MTAGELKIAGGTFLVLTVTVAINLFAMQEQRGVSSIETSALGARMAQPAQGWEMSGSIGAADAAGGQPLAAGVPQPLDAAAIGGPSNGMPDVVRGIQRELNARGYDAGQPDGVAGLVTRAAIMAYEHDYGLPLTAGATQDLLSRIVLGSSAPSPANTAASRTAGHEAENVIRSVKQQLTARGYAIGNIDGTRTEQLARAIREFELDQKLPETGRISGPLVSRLTRLQAQPTVAPVPRTKAAQK